MTTTRFTVRQRIRYRIDNALSRGVGALLLWLGLFTAVVILVVAIIAWLLNLGPGDSEVGFLEALWLAMTRSLDPGTFSGDEGLKFRMLMLLITMTGIFVVSFIIGLISNSIDRRLETLREGTSPVVEADHTLILGYSYKVGPIIRELVEANRSRKGAAVVILSAEDPRTVFDTALTGLSDLHGTRVVVRRGEPSRIDDLQRMNAAQARSIIVLADEADQTDSRVVKVVLALARIGISPDRTPTVAEVSDPSVAESLADILGPSLLTVDPLGTVARITARVLRTSGLGAVYQDLLDFGGDEVYTTAIPDSLIGRTFGDLLQSSSMSSVIGLLRGSDVYLPPALDMVTTAGDLAVAISADDSSLTLDLIPAVSTDTLPEPNSGALEPERMLVVGWSRLGHFLAEDNERHVAPGSHLHIVIDPQLHDIQTVTSSLRLVNQELHTHSGNPVERGVMSTALASGPFSHIIILAEREALPIPDADARALLALLHVRQYLDTTAPANVERPNVVAELLDPNDVSIGEVARPDDFIVSERLVSLALAQLSENPHIAPVIRRLVEADGTSLSLIPAVRLGITTTLSYADVVAAARRAGVVAIGLRHTRDGEQRVALNPPKDGTVSCDPDDFVIVMARG
jgi:hypothetical protein